MALNMQGLNPVICIINSQYDRRISLPFVVKCSAMCDSLVEDDRKAAW